MISANKNITTGFTVAALVLFATAAVVSAAEGPAVMVTDYKVEPAVLMPGDTGIITVTVQNMDTQSSETETTTTGKYSPSETTKISKRSISAEIEGIRLSGSDKNIQWAFFAGVNSNARIKRATELLAKVGLRERMHHKPSELSGGQQQRVAIARALSNNPAVIICDEPTGNVDSETGDAIMGILEGLNRNEGRTIIVVTHDTEIAAHAPRVIRMKDGRLLEE